MIENDFGSISVSLQVRAFIGTERESFSWVWQSRRRKTFLGAASDFRFRCTFRKKKFRFRVSTELGRYRRLTDARFLWPRSKTLPDELCLLASALASYRTPLHTRTLSPTHTWWVLLSLTLSLSLTHAQALQHIHLLSLTHTHVTTTLCLCTLAQTLTTHSCSPSASCAPVGRN